MQTMQKPQVSLLGRASFLSTGMFTSLKRIERVFPEISIQLQRLHTPLTELVTP